MTQTRHTEVLESGIEQLGLIASDAMIVQLMTYLRELVSWNQAYNLTAVREPEAMVIRHLLDSLAITHLIGHHRLIDVGCGAGLPGIPLAIVRPDLEVTLLDSNGKKVRFINHVRRTVPLGNIHPVQQRVESYQFEPGFETVTSRAFQDPLSFIKSAGRLLCDGGALIAMTAKLDSTFKLPEDGRFQLTACHKLTVPMLNEPRQALVFERSH